MEKKFTIQRKLLKLMRFSLVQLCLLILSATVALAHETNAQELLDRSISVKIDNENLKKSIKIIEKITDVSFSYRKGVLDNGKKVSIDAQDEKLSKILNQIFSNTNIEYEVLGQQIILTKVKKTSQVPPSVSELKKEGNISETPQQVAIIVSGTITDELNEPLVGASVVVKGTTNGTVTNEFGQFSLLVPDKESVLVITYIGHQTQEITGGTQTPLKIVLIADANALNEVVVVGYGTQKKVNLTGAVGVATSERLENRAINTVGEGLQGVIPNLNVVVRNGDPTAAVDFNIRGYESINGGAPLILVDGVPMDLNRLNPSDIKSVSVLKDAAAAAIYGARAAFGVVLVETKKVSPAK